MSLSVSSLVFILFLIFLFAALFGYNYLHDVPTYVFCSSKHDSGFAFDSKTGLWECIWSFCWTKNRFLMYKILPLIFFLWFVQSTLQIWASAKVCMTITWIPGNQDDVIQELRLEAFWWRELITGLVMCIKVRRALSIFCLSFCTQTKYKFYATVTIPFYALCFSGVTSKRTWNQENAGKD